MPPRDHGPDPPHEKPLPRLIRAEGHELPVDKLAAARDAAQPREGVVEDDQHDRQREPDESVVHVVHDVLELSDGEAQHQYRPTELVDLEADVVLVHGGDTYDEGRGVEQEGEYGGALADVVGVEEVVCGGVGFDHVDDEIGVGVKNGRDEPHPLRGAEEGYGLLDDVEEGVVTDFDEFTEEHDLGEENEGADVDVAAEHEGDEDADHEDSGYEADEYFFEFGFIFFDGGFGHCSPRSISGGRRGRYS